MLRNTLLFVPNGLRVSRGFGFLGERPRQPAGVWATLDSAPCGPGHSCKHVLKGLWCVHGLCWRSLPEETGERRTTRARAFFIACLYGLDRHIHVHHSPRQNVLGCRRPQALSHGRDPQRSLKVTLVPAAMRNERRPFRAPCGARRQGTRG